MDEITERHYICYYGIIKKIFMKKIFSFKPLEKKILVIFRFLLNIIGKLAHDLSQVFQNFRSPCLIKKTTENINTFFRSMETVILRNVLDVVDQCGFWQQMFVFIDAINGVLEGQLCAAVLLVLSKYRSWKKFSAIDDLFNKITVMTFVYKRFTKTAPS